ncbi:MAG: hypothetical protein ABSD11_01000 [Methylocella sp.]|jgi:hypothetical protein
MVRSGNLTITRHRLSVTGNCTMKWGRCKRPENRPYVESQVRPHKTGLEHDFSSDLLDKPVDTAYGPYADNFPEAQHKYGLFQPIRTELERLKAEKDKIQDKAR